MLPGFTLSPDGGEEAEEHFGTSAAAATRRGRKSFTAAAAPIPEREERKGCMNPLPDLWLGNAIVTDLAQISRHLATLLALSHACTFNDCNHIVNHLGFKPSLSSYQISNL